MSENVIKMENIKEGLLVAYIHGYGKNKTEYIGEFKGYEGNKVRIGRWEFKDQVVMKERLLGVFHDPKNDVEMGVDISTNPYLDVEMDVDMYEGETV